MATPFQSIRDIVNSQPAAAAILKRFDIDVSTHATASLAETCRELQLSVEQVLEKLEDGAGDRIGGSLCDPATLSASRLIQSIVRVHHLYVRQKLPRMVELARAVAQTDGGRMPELSQIVFVTEELQSQMHEHFHKEEGVLFPYIAHMDEASPAAFRPPQACFRRVSEPVFAMMQEHERARLLMSELRRLTSGFEAPSVNLSTPNFANSRKTFRNTCGWKTRFCFRAP